MIPIATLLTGADDLSRVVAVTGGHDITLVQLRRDVAENAVRLADIGCRRGALVATDTYWALVGMLALFQIGAEIVLPQNITAGGLADIRDHWDLLICDRLPAGQTEGFVLRHGTSADDPMKILDPVQRRLNLFTSGSVGTPKLVQKSLATMEREAAAIETIIGSSVPLDARVLGTVSHQHMFGLSYKLFWPLCTGRRIDGAVYDLWEALLDQPVGAAAIVSSPAHLTRLAMQERLPLDRQPSVVLSAGAFLPLTASAAATDLFGKAVCEIYGSTETGTIAWRERGSVDLPWQTFPGVSVVPASDGAIRLNSPFLPDDAPFDGSDVIELVAPNRFHLKGRLDRVAKIDGKRVSLPQIEAQLIALPLVAAAAVVVLPGAPEVLAAVIEPSEAGRSELVRLGAFRFGRLLREALAQSQEPAGRPRRWRFVDALPKNAMGKTPQQDLSRLFEADMAEVRPAEPDVRAVRQGDGAVELDLFNRPDLQQLDGHFPNMPIIPGVAQIDWAVRYAARHLALPIDAATHFQVKFHRLTLPGTVVTLKLAHDTGRQRLSFVYSQGEQTLTSGVIRTSAS